MASGFTPAPAAKRSRTAGEGPSVRKQGKDHSIPWDDIYPVIIRQWLDTFSKANNATSDILLARVLPTVACLLGPSTVKVDCRIRAETVNLYMICLCDPGAGKSPAFQHGCAHPIRLHVEAKEDNPLFVDEFTEAGLFRQLKATRDHKAIIGKEEASQFLEQPLGASHEKSLIDLERMIQWVIYSAIFEFSHSENGPATCSLDQAGNTKYEEFIDRISASLNSQWARNISPEDVSKDDRHVLRLAAVMHVFYDQLTKLLRGDEKSPPPQLVVSGAETNTNSYDRQRRILTCKGPFVSTRLAQKNVSGNARPSVAILNTTMENLATDGLGEVNVVDRSTVFYKMLPADVNEETLAGYEVEREAYLRAFNERADKAVISKHLFNKFLEQSVHKVRLREEHDITPEEA